MRSIPLAIVWESLTRRCWNILAAMLGVNLFPVLLFSALRQAGSIPSHHPSMILVHITLLPLNMFILAAAILSVKSHPRQLYTMPIPTSTIVTWHMIPPMLLVMLGSVMMTTILNLAFHLDWPIWGPALFVGAAMALIQAVLWLTERTGWSFWGIVLSCAGLGSWYKMRYGPFLGLPQRFWDAPSALEVATLAVITCGSLLLGVVAVARNRRGDTLGSVGSINWLGRMFDPLSEVSFRAASPSQAYFWCEWRRKGWAMPVTVLAGILLGLSLWAVFSRDLISLFREFMGGGLLLMTAAFVGGLIMGNTGRSDTSYEMGSFQATRPMTTVAMARISLRVVLYSVSLAWTIWATALLVIYLTLRAATNVSVRDISPQFDGWFVVATLIGPWIIAALGSSIGLAGRALLFPKIFVGIFLGYIVLGSVLTATLDDGTLRQVDVAAPFAMGIALIVATWAVFAWALRRDLLNPTKIYIAAIAWIGMLAVIGSIHSLDRPLSAGMLVVVAGLAALAVAPFAAAPLALASNRTR